MINQKTAEFPTPLRYGSRGGSQILYECLVFQKHTRVQTCSISSTMPALSSKDAAPTVLVSGANGYLATWIIDVLLKRGYIIRAAVRTEAKGQDVLELFQSHREKGKIDLVVVGDIATEGAFNEAVKDVDGIIHTATPVHLGAREPSEMIDPAVNGTLGLLKSAMKFGNNLKRVIITSSCAAVKEAVLKPNLDETDWNELSVLECEQKGKNAHPLDMYAASKTISEKSAWQFVQEHTSELKWDLTVLTPPWIFGPPLHKVASLENLNSSNMYWYKAVYGEIAFGQDPDTDPMHGWMDIRDAAEAHARAMETPAAGGERIIVCAGSPYVWNDLRDAAKGVPPKVHSVGIIFNTAKADRILGLEYRSLKQMTSDMLAYVTKMGWQCQVR
ncbi:D-lactaldehyde dehydrogenase [Lentinula raphanica]|nr:D-lactaldehyde dehydrogenase [Lentinula raphanica]